MSLGKLAQLLKENKLTGVKPKSGGARHFLDMGYPPLNEVISGDMDKGLPSGQVVMVAGPSACGKTVLSMEMMKSAQRQGGFAAFFDHETQFQMELAVSQGLDDDPEKFQYYQPDTFEESVTEAINLATLIRENNVIEPTAPIVFIFDSLVTMIPKSKWDSVAGVLKTGEEKKKRLSMHDNFALSAATNAWMPVIQKKFDQLGVTGIFLNQVRKQTDPHGNISFTFPGGDMPYFICSTVIVLTAKDHFIGVGDDRKLIKKEVTALIQKSRNTVPHQRIKYDFVLADGTGKFDVIGSYADFLGVKAFDGAGMWVTYKGKKYQGIPNLKAALYDDPDALEELKRLHAAIRVK